MAKKISCYECIHNPVCKYFGKWENRFPYKSDLYIKDYLEGLTHVLAKACSYFVTKEKYSELLMAVENKYKNETRHETALRYIKEHENKSGIGEAAKSNQRMQPTQRAGG